MWSRTPKWGALRSNFLQIKEQLFAPAESWWVSSKAPLLNERVKEKKRSEQKKKVRKLWCLKSEYHCISVGKGWGIFWSTARVLLQRTWNKMNYYNLFLRNSYWRIVSLFFLTYLIGSYCFFMSSIPTHWIFVIVSLHVPFTNISRHNDYLFK